MTHNFGSDHPIIMIQKLGCQELSELFKYVNIKLIQYWVHIVNDLLIRGTFCIGCFYEGVSNLLAKSRIMISAEKVIYKRGYLHPPINSDYYVLC